MTWSAIITPQGQGDESWGVYTVKAVFDGSDWKPGPITADSIESQWMIFQVEAEGAAVGVYGISFGDGTPNYVTYAVTKSTAAAEPDQLFVVAPVSTKGGPDPSRDIPVIVAKGATPSVVRFMMLTPTATWPPP